MSQRTVLPINNDEKESTGTSFASCCQALKIFTCINSPTSTHLTTILWVRYYYFHVTDEVMEALRIKYVAQSQKKSQSIWFFDQWKTLTDSKVLSRESYFPTSRQVKYKSATSKPKPPSQSTKDKVSYTGDTHSFSWIWRTTNENRDTRAEKGKLITSVRKS